MKVGNLDCTMCLDCVHACPHDNIALVTRIPGAESARARATVRHRPARAARRPCRTRVVFTLPRWSAPSR
jgi:polyferredoxin